MDNERRLAYTPQPEVVVTTTLCSRNEHLSSREILFKSLIRICTSGSRTAHCQLEEKGGLEVVSLSPEARNVIFDDQFIAMTNCFLSDPSIPHGATPSLP